MSVLRAGIVGYGYMGEIRRAVVERSDVLETAAIADTRPEVRDRVGDVPVFASFEEMLAETDPDVVFVCTPNRFIPEVAVAAMNAGKHVFCEKPPGRTLSDVQAMRAAEAANPGVKLMFGFNHRFHPGVMKAKVLVDSGRLGRVLGMRGIYGKSGGVGFRDSWRNAREVSGGGILLDQGIHMLDLFRHFVGEFQRVKCFTADSYWRAGLEDNAYVVLQNEAGVSAMLHSSATLWKHTFSITLILEDGYLVVDGLLSKTGSYGRERLVVGRRQFEDEADAVGNPAEEVTYFDRDLSWDLEVAAFAECVLSDQPVATSSSVDALRAMEIVHAAYADAARGGEGTA